MALSTLSRSIKGEVAIVTGAASGMGRATAHLFGDEGARVALIDINDEPLQAVVKEMTDAGYDAKGWALDLSDEAAIEKVFFEIGDHFGGIDILVNNAGITLPGNSQELTVADWDRITGVNLRSLFLTTKFSVPHLRRSSAGRIVNIASAHASAGGGGPAYAPAKAGVVNLTRDSAVELAGDNITVNAV